MDLTSLTGSTYADPTTVVTGILTVGGLFLGLKLAMVAVNKIRGQIK